MMANQAKWIPQVGDKVRVLVAKDTFGDVISLKGAAVVFAVWQSVERVGFKDDNHEVMIVKFDQIAPWVDSTAPTANVTVLADDSLGGVMREFREVKRKAAVGERVKLIDLSSFGGAAKKKYHAGDIERVTGDNGASVCLDVDGSWMSGTYAYVVLEPTDIVHVAGSRFRMVERTALLSSSLQVGEKVLIISNRNPWNGFEIGSVASVIRDSGELIDAKGVSASNGKGLEQTLKSHQYLVLEPLEIAEPAPACEPSDAERIQALEQRVAALEAQLAGGTAAQSIEQTVHSLLRPNTPPAPKPKTPNELRAGIVEQAKRDVEALIVAMDNGHDKSEGNNWCRYYHTRVEFVVNREERTVVALLRLKYGESVKERGIAKCAPDDVFNAHIGKAIALRRALGLDVPDAYLKAPKPTEAQVGDVVLEYDDQIRPRTIVAHGNQIVFRGNFLTTQSGSLNAIRGKLIDDTRDGYVYDVEKWRQAQAKAVKTV